jgi:carbamate kinase
VEAAAVKRLVAEGCIVIASGGGGPPVYLHHSRGWEGIEAVVDKDRVAAVLGKRLKADTLLILTNVDAVYRDWGTDAAAPISRLSVTEARELVVGGGLGVGSMTPKLEAAADFVESGGRRAIIAHLDAGLDALRLGTGTHIIGEIE